MNATHIFDFDPSKIVLSSSVRSAGRDFILHLYQGLSNWNCLINLLSIINTESMQLYNFMSIPNWFVTSVTAVCVSYYSYELFERWVAISRYGTVQSGSIVQTLDHIYVFVCFHSQCLLYSYGLAIIINAKQNIRVNTFDVNRLITARASKICQCKYIYIIQSITSCYELFDRLYFKLNGK